MKQNYSQDMQEPYGVPAGSGEEGITGGDTSLYALPDDDDDPSQEGSTYDGYVLEDDDFEDEGGVNYAQSAGIVDETAEGAEEKERSGKSASPFGIMFRTMFSPVEGWKYMKRAGISPEKFAVGCFYPTLALASLSQFSLLFYEAHQTVAGVIVSALITFLSLFFGYFLAIPISQIVLPKKGKEFIMTPFGKEFIMVSISTIALFWTFFNLFPMIGPVLVFLPLWTVYMIFKGVKVMRIPENDQPWTVVWLSAFVIGLPLGWSLLLSELLPMSGL